MLCTFQSCPLSPWSNRIIEICSFKVREVLLKMEGQFPDGGALFAEDKWRMSSAFNSLQQYGHLVAFIQSTHGTLVI